MDVQQKQRASKVKTPFVGDTLKSGAIPQMHSASNLQGITGLQYLPYAAGGGGVGIGRPERAGDSKQSALFAADQPTSWPYMSHS